MICHLLSEIKKADICDILVVTGFESEKISAAIEEFDVATIFNPDFQTGMHSSIRVALASLTKSYDSFFICPGDLPSLRGQTFRSLVTASEMDSRKIFYPVFDGRRGHPVLMSSDFIPEILQHPDGDFGCSYILKKHPNECVEVPCSYNGVWKDLDNIQDYRSLNVV